jgi:hypothetical protein
MAFQDDGVSTETSVSQEDVEQDCLRLLFAEPQGEGPLRELGRNAPVTNRKRAVVFVRDQHVAYLRKGLESLSGAFVSLDASRPWLVYWILHSLSLLDALPEAKVCYGRCGMGCLLGDEKTRPAAMGRSVKASTHRSVSRCGVAEWLSAAPQSEKDPRLCLRLPPPHATPHPPRSFFVARRHSCRTVYPSSANAKTPTAALLAGAYQVTCASHPCLTETKCCCPHRCTVGGTYNR